MKFKVGEFYKYDGAKVIMLEGGRGTNFPPNFIKVYHYPRDLVLLEHKDHLTEWVEPEIKIEPNIEDNNLITKGQIDNLQRTVIEKVPVIERKAFFKVLAHSYQITIWINEIIQQGWNVEKMTATEVCDDSAITSMYLICSREKRGDE